MISPRREMEALGGLQQQALALGIGRGQLVEQLLVQFGIGADAAVLRQPSIARRLARACRVDPGPGRERTVPPCQNLTETRMASTSALW